VALLLGLEHGGSPVTRRSANNLFALESSAFQSPIGNSNLSLSTYLNIYLSTYLSIYLSTSLAFTSRAV
jgi:hypothetical protein